MKGLLVVVLFAVVGARAQSPVPVAAPAAERPRLLVLCSVDQLAAWVFDAGLPHLAEHGGFRRLLRAGARFQHCEFEHACSETGPGHATIGTGVAARVHGIARNKWWVRETRLGIYCVDEPMPPLPEWPEGKNRGPGLLLAPTLATALKAGVPGSRVGSVSWKDRSAILMAGKQADLAVWCEASTGRFVTNTAWTKLAPAWLVAWNERNELGALFGTVWERSGPESAYEGLVDDRPYELVHGNGKGMRTLPQALTGATTKAGPEFHAQVYASPFGNSIVRSAAQAMVVGMQLGADDVPDLLCVSFSSTDVVGHVFGPESVEARDALLRLDHELATFLTFLDAQVGKDKWAMFVTADHGVGMTPEWAKTKGLDAGRGAITTMVGVFAEKAVAEALGPPPAGRRFVSHVGEFSVYFDDEVLDAVRGERTLAEARAAAAAAVVAVATKVRGVEVAYATADLLAPGGAPDALRRSLVDAIVPGRAGEVQFVVKANWLDGTTPASHGTPHPYDRQVIGLAVGRGVPAGALLPDRFTPGFGVVWYAQMLGLPRPAGANDVVPASFGERW